MPAGIEVRHLGGCRSRAGGGCNCKPTYRASVWSARDGKRIRKGFPSMAAAKAWRNDASAAVHRGAMRAPAATTLAEAAAAWLESARSGAVRTRSGDPYKPASIRTYEAALRLRVLPVFGANRLVEVRTVDLQEFVDTLLADGLNPATISTTVIPLQALFSRALSRGEVATNPTRGLRLPAVRSRRDRIADPIEAARLLASLPLEDRAVWATAMYAGLRRGELMALQWEDVDLAAGTIVVRRSWDAKEGADVGPKTVGGRRSVPVPAVLRDHLVEHRMRTGRSAGFVFGPTGGDRPFQPAPLVERADAAWEAAGLRRIGLHESRHTFASLMIAAGVNAKALSVYMGHASVAFTFDRYGHLMPGNEGEAAGLLDAFLERANTDARLAQIG